MSSIIFNAVTGKALQRVIDRRSKGTVQEVLTLLFSGEREAGTGKIDKNKAQRDAEVRTATRRRSRKVLFLYIPMFQALIGALKTSEDFCAVVRDIVAKRNVEQVREACEAFRQISGGDDLSDILIEEMGPKDAFPYVSFSRIS